MLLFTGLFLVWSLVIIYSVYTANVKILDQDAKNSLENNAIHTANQINRMLYERYLDIRELASDPVINAHKSTPGMISGKLTEYLNRHTMYESLSFFNMNRVRIADTSEKEIGKQYLLEDYWLNITKGEDFVVDIHQSLSLRKPVFHLASTVKDKEGTPIGVVVARMNIEELYDVINQAFVSHNEETVYYIDLVDKYGLILYSLYNKQGILKDTSLDWEEIKKSLWKEKRRAF